MNPARLFPEFIVAFLSFGFFVATLVCTVRDGATQSDTLIILLIVISSLSGIAGYTRFITDRTIESLCAACETNDDDEGSGEGIELQLELQPVYYNNPYLDMSNGFVKGAELVPSHDKSIESGSSSSDVNQNQILRWSRIVKSLLQPSRTTFLLLHGPACILHLYITARLFAVDNFQTHPINLDFGPKYGNSSESYEQNIAFDAGFNSYVHSLQGFLAAFLSFPAVSGWLARKIGGIDTRGRVDFYAASMTVSVTTLTYSVLTIYPTYNFFKTFAESFRIFASTSFANNNLEWTMGYLLGLSLGMLWTSVMRRLLVVIYPMKHEEGLDAFIKTFDVGVDEVCQTVLYGREGFGNEESESGNTPETESTKNEHGTTYDNENKTKYAFGKLEEFASTMPVSQYCSGNWDTILFNIYHVECATIINIISKVFLAFFDVSVLLCGISMGATWNNCLEEDGNKCINSTTNGVTVGQRLAAVFMFSFVGIQMVFIIISKRYLKRCV